MNLKEMGNLHGEGMSAGCAVAGGVTAVSVFFVWTGAGAAFFGGALLASAAMGCFEGE